MPMREDCRHYQSRTYRSGEVARWCAKDLAPEAPWRCPEECPSFRPRSGDAGFTVGSLVTPAPPPPPPTPDVAGVLDEAEDIVNLVGPEVLSEWEIERARADRAGLPFWKRLFKRAGRRR